MSERLFLFIVGAIILSSLYFEIDTMIYLLCLWLLFEAITNIRLTTLSQKLISKTVATGLIVFQTKIRFGFDAFRVLRIVVSSLVSGLCNNGVGCQWYLYNGSVNSLAWI